MSCNRCEHIHEAQKSGRTDKACKCDCHIGTESGTDYVFNVTPDNSTVDSGATLTTAFNLDNSGTAVGPNY